MNPPWQIRVYDDERVYVADLTGAAEIGRQLNRDEAQPAHVKVGEGWRVVIAPLDEVTISRRHLEVKPLGDGRFQLTNRSANQVVGLPTKRRELAPGATCRLALPIVLRVGSRTLRLQEAQATQERLESLPMATMAPGSGSSLLPELRVNLGRSAGSAMGPDQLTGWIHAFLGLLQSAAGSEDFYGQAARALVDLVKLDAGRVLLRQGQRWHEQAQQSASRVNAADWRPSTRILTSVLTEKKTFWQVPESQPDSSTIDVDAVVAAPILDRSGNVLGALYGERRMGGVQFQPITQLEAMLVEVLAHGVAAGLARVEQERAALRTRMQMEQFFTPRLAAKLEDHPELLVGRDSTISVLFCDIRGFSTITERLGPKQTLELIGDAMSALTQCVLDHDGVVVDYAGDEVMAMWGAPETQADHAVRACRAALAMFDCLPALNARWQPIIQQPLDISIGVNSGEAQVGNVGSRIKFKYGALGNTVNLGSRTQGATKHLKASMLVTDATKNLLGDTYQTRRLCQVGVVNIAQPVTLYELARSPQSGWSSLKRDYELALDEFNRGEFRQACRILGRLILEHPNDGPSLLLLSRAVGFLVHKPDPFDPVMRLDEK